MPSLIIRFAVDLNDRDDYFTPKGPLFHKWLPNGKLDAITLKTEDKNFELRVWFNRKGYKSASGFIEYDHKRKEIDEDTMKRQAILDAGPLHGELHINGVSQADIKILTAKDLNNPVYIKLGKKIAKILYNSISRLLDLLRTNYSQYWIAQVKKWNSKNESLGVYLSSYLQVEWSADKGKSWQRFQPTEMNKTIRVVMPSEDVFEEFLTIEDYKSIKDFMKRDTSPSLAATTLVYSYQLLDQGHLRHAIVEAATALEIALHEFYRSKLLTNPVLLKNIENFWNLSKKAQLVAIALTIPEIETDLLEESIQMIDIRNKIVHEGYTPSLDLKTIKTTRKFITIVSLLINQPKFKFPTRNVGNKLYPK